jgi:crotonobetaine/carnitine-CoA ligase
VFLPLASFIEAHFRSRDPINNCRHNDIYKRSSIWFDLNNQMNSFVDKLRSAPLDRAAEAKMTRFDTSRRPSADLSQPPFDTRRLPTVQDCISRELLERWGHTRPDAPFAVFAEDGRLWTYGEALEDIRAMAARLAALGVRQGEHVATWLPNGRRLLTAWLAINYLGAVYVPLNLAYRGRMLEHALALSDARVMFVEPELAPRLAEVDRAALRILLMEGGNAPDGVEVHRPEDPLLASQGRPGVDEVREIQPWDTQAVIFTSGTTGPSKGVLVSYAQLHVSARSHPYRWSDQERGLVYSPLFHVAAIGPVMRALGTGGSIAVLERFVTQRFWADVRRTGATVTSMMGSMAAFLLAQPASEDERQTPLRTILLNPLTAESRKLAERIGADFYTNFSMSETALPIVSALNPSKVGTCGRPRPGVEARVFDPNDCELPIEAVGELVLRTDMPWNITAGYHKDPAATARAWRNGWFHTGDAVRLDAEGDVVFVDRLKDAIRRRGENISSYEVEVEVLAHPDITDCAAVAAASDLGEDEVLVAAERKPESRLTERELLIFLEPRMPHFMLPRYIRFTDLPRTPTQKIQKAALREAGVAPGTWDREAAGIRVTRAGLVGA